MDKHSETIARIVSKAWTDPSYMKRLKENPKEVLEEAGLQTRGAVQLHENSDSATHFVIPKRPPHIKDEDLKKTEVHPELCCTVCF